MKISIKCMKLDLLLLKPYLKSMLLILMVPLIFPFFTGTLFEGMSFAVTIMAMTTAYTFSIAEKNGLERFYGFLPVSRKNLVAGRYLAVFGIGFLALLLEAAAQSLLLFFVTHAIPKPFEIIGSILICSLLFCIYAGVQIPGYYKYGSIRGKIFMFIPTVGFLVFYYLFRLLGGDNQSPYLSIFQNPAALTASAAALIFLLIAGSMALSNSMIRSRKD